jgi:large subunit ribosomal protein L17
MTKQMGGRKLGVTSSHRRALLRNMAVSLLLHEKVTTTLAKAKELRPFAEKIITHAVKGQHVIVRRHVHNKTVYNKLFSVIAPRYSNRPGGYTRLLRLGARVGDNSPRGLVELLP